MNIYSLKQNPHNVFFKSNNNKTDHNNYDSKSSCDLSFYDYSSSSKKAILNAFKSNMISFSGINKSTSNKAEQELSNYLYKKASDIKKLIDSSSNAPGLHAGKVPEEWNIQNGTSDDLIKSIGKIVSDFRNGMSQKLTEHKIKGTLVKAGVITKQDDINFKYVNKGGYGIVYSFSVNDKKYALKIFYEPQDAENDYHGSLIETNRALFLNKHMPDNQFVKLYFADLKHGYQLNEYVDQDAKARQFDKKELKEKLSQFGLRFIDDKFENLINGRIIDYGGLEIISDEYVKL